MSEKASVMQLDRRRFLKYIGVGATVVAGFGPLGCRSSVAAGSWVRADGSPDWVSPKYPVPLPSDSAPISQDAKRLASFVVEDDLVLPEGWRYDVIASWGDRFGAPGHEVAFGYNNDYTGLVPIEGSEDEFWLFVNFEYVAARPWLQALEAEGVDIPKFRLIEDASNPLLYSKGRLEIAGWATPGPKPEVQLEPGINDPEVPAEVREAIRAISHMALDDQGVTVLRVRRDADGRFSVVDAAPDHRRIAGHRSFNLASGVEHAYTGPAAWLFDRAPRGTLSNCSGGTAPWGHFLTCEENFHTQAHEAIDPGGQPRPNDRLEFAGSGRKVGFEIDYSIEQPNGLYGFGMGIEDPLDGRGYGWVCEVDPTTGKMQKHTSLGRFRHENVTVRAEKGKRLAAYMGDDRRGGHVWKFVSDDVVDDPTDVKTSELLTRGTLYVARFNPPSEAAWDGLEPADTDFTGRWSPLVPETPLATPEPEHTPSQHIEVPSRPVGGTVAVGDIDRDNPDVEVDFWKRVHVERFAGKSFDECTLGDLVRPEPTGDPSVDRERALGVLLAEASAMANACGGTPTARPEDLEVHPMDGSVYIAFTDATEGDDGSPDMRIFPDSKGRSSRQYGAIYRIVEDGDDPAAETFRWGRFIATGEVAEQGGGFACADNLVFDPQGNLWVVTDISTSVQNFPTTRQLANRTDRGAKFFPGVFGNNALFMIPTSGDSAGIPHLFAIGPMECEFCGPTFTEDGKTLILSVQHPGEELGTRVDGASEDETFIIHDRADQPFEQVRTVPVGSNWPSKTSGDAPRPSVICITRDA
ncbi:MAG: alkaline phosphatase PhoX [Acidobacteriota bacterium]